MGELRRAQGRARPHKPTPAGIPLGVKLPKAEPSIGRGRGLLHSQQ